MRHFASADFWISYDALPAEVKSLADKSFALLKQDRKHPSLSLKKVGRYWSARVGLRYRALAAETHGDLVWFWIGTHSEYDQIIR
jgi:hypothetical protein